RFLRWIRSFWKRLSRSAREASRRLQQRVRQRLAARTAGAPSRRGFLSLRQLSPRERVRYFYLSMVHHSAREGLGRRASQTPIEYEQVLIREIPEIAEEIHVLTQHFVEARYTEHDVSRERAYQARSVWQQIKRLLALRRRRSRKPRGAASLPES
ncbi:MAG: DUF4129 domain-containing protein, partial [Chloroflexi bacterium]|nr:DUF4129 domain-containing protein [Chloroflexota bacterium]